MEVHIRTFQDPRVEVAWNLSGTEPDAKALRQSADEMCIGGLRNRNPCHNNQRLSQVVSAGTCPREIIRDTWRKFPGLQNQILGMIANKNAVELDLEHVRLFWGARLGVADVSGVATASCTTDLRYALLRAIAEKAADPDRAIVEWLVQGVLSNIHDPGIFPLADNPVGRILQLL